MTAFDSATLEVLWTRLVSIVDEAAAALVRRFFEGTLPQRGAMPCVGLLTLADFAREIDGLAITMQEASA